MKQLYNMLANYLLPKVDYLRGFHISYDPYCETWRANRYGVTMNNRNYDSLINMILKREVW
jgi:hypothetical protein